MAPDLPIKSWPEDARGKRVSFADVGSTSGWLVPTAWFRTGSINPKEYFNYSDGATHAANEIDVAGGQVDCATDFDRNRNAMIEPGELVTVLGSSGAGKTTLFRCLTGLTRPDAGSVEVTGRDICLIAGHDQRETRREVALIFQQFNLVRRLTARQNVLAGPLAYLPAWRVVARRFPRDDRQLTAAPRMRPAG